MQDDLMVFSDLQRALITEIGTILKDLITTVNNDERTGFNGYAQFLPKAIENDDDLDYYFPYFIVRIDNGTTVDDYSTWTVTADILIGICDTGEENQGHYHVLEAITRITTRFAMEATLGNPGHKAFRCLPEMSWHLQDEDTWPYYFGAVELKFMVPKPARKEPLGYGY